MGFKSSMRQDSMKSKAARATGAAAVSIAAKSGDPLVKKMKAAKAKYESLKSQVMKKYGSKGKQAVMQAAKKK